MMMKKHHIHGVGGNQEMILLYGNGNNITVMGQRCNRKEFWSSKTKITTLGRFFIAGPIILFSDNESTSADVKISTP